MVRGAGAVCCAHCMAAEGKARTSIRARAVRLDLMKPPSVLPLLRTGVARVYRWEVEASAGGRKKGRAGARPWWTGYSLGIEGAGFGWVGLSTGSSGLGFAGLRQNLWVIKHF